MKKICCIVLTALCLLPCLAGCGKANAVNEEPLIRSFVIGNSTAEIHIPAAASVAVRVGGKPVEDSSEVRLVSRDAVKAVLAAGPGAYRFTAG